MNHNLSGDSNCTGEELYNLCEDRHRWGLQGSHVHDRKSNSDFCITNGNESNIDHYNILLPLILEQPEAIHYVDESTGMKPISAYLDSCSCCEPPTWDCGKYRSVGSMPTIGGIEALTSYYGTRYSPDVLWYTDNNGDTVLHIICRHSRQNNAELLRWIVREILEHNPMALYTRNSEGKTALEVSRGKNKEYLQEIHGQLKTETVDAIVEESGLPRQLGHEIWGYSKL